MLRETLGDIFSKVLPRLLPNRVRAHYADASLIFSEEDGVSRSSESLLNLSLAAIQNARAIDLQDLDLRWSGTEAAKVGEPFLRPSLWPGEHYRLLTGLVMSLKPRLVVEVGTGGGLSALAMKASLPHGARVVTFDIVDWRAGRPFNVLRPADFEDGRLAQHVADLSLPAEFARHADLIARADLIFIDGPKDGHTEQRFLDHLSQVESLVPPLLVLDDIRLWNMLGIWRRIPYPKLDLTSFGHYTGTGLVEWPRFAGGRKPGKTQTRA